MARIVSRRRADGDQAGRVGAQRPRIDRTVRRHSLRTLADGEPYWRSIDLRNPDRRVDRKSPGGRRGYGRRNQEVQSGGALKMKILRPSDVNARLAAGETPESIFFDGAGGAVAKLLGPEGAISNVSGQKRSLNIT